MPILRLGVASKMSSVTYKLYLGGDRILDGFGRAVWSANLSHGHRPRGAKMALGLPKVSRLPFLGAGVL